MRPTTRTLCPALLAAALAAGGCVTSKSDAPPPSAPAAERTVHEPAAPGGPGPLAYAAAVPENVVWLPWKMIGGGVKGASDGVQAGFDKGRMPLFGALFAPVNLAAGFVTGFAEGLAMSPMLVGPGDDFGRVMASPTKRTTNVWWYP